MTRLTLSTAAALTLAMSFCSAASAYDWTTTNVGQNNVYTSTTQLPLVAIGDCNGAVNCNSACEDFACDSCDDCCGPGVFFEFDWLLLQYFRADGLRVGAGAAEAINGTFESAPRLTFGYITPGGLGTRIRYFEFDHDLIADSGDPTERLELETLTVDLELFERFALDGDWDLEGSFGVRYNEFSERMVDNDELRENRFHGFGVIAGLELRRQIATGAIYGRVRQALLSDDKFRFNFSNFAVGSGAQTLLDTVVGITEINIGYELSRELDNGGLLYGRIGGEYQLWSNYSSKFTTTTGDPEAFWTGSSDVGFAGVSFTVGLLY